MKKIHRTRERKPRRKFLNLRHAIIWAITAITHLSQLTTQTNGQPPLLMYFLNFGHNQSMQMLMDSLKTFHLPVQLLLSQPSSRTDLGNDSLARHSRRSIRAPDLSCPVKLRPLKYRAVCQILQRSSQKGKILPFAAPEVFPRPALRGPHEEQS